MRYSGWPECRLIPEHPAEADGLSADWRWRLVEHFRPRVRPLGRLTLLVSRALGLTWD